MDDLFHSDEVVIEDLCALDNRPGDHPDGIKHVMIAIPRILYVALFGRGAEDAYVMEKFVRLDPSNFPEKAKYLFNQALYFMMDENTAQGVKFRLKRGGRDLTPDFRRVWFKCVDGKFKGIAFVATCEKVSTFIIQMTIDLDEDQS